MIIVTNVLLVDRTLTGVHLAVVGVRSSVPPPPYQSVPPSYHSSFASQRRAPTVSIQRLDASLRRLDTGSTAAIAQAQPLPQRPPPQQQQPATAAPPSEEAPPPYAEAIGTPV